MATQIQRYRTARFIDWSPLIAIGAWMLIPAAWLIALFLARPLINKMVSVAPNQATLLPPIQPRKSVFGAVRVDAIPQLSDNTWAIFEIQVKDNQGNVLVSAVKQAWRESGRWVEDGESGTWSEQDLRGRLEIQQGSITSPLVISLAVLEQGTVGGQPLVNPVIFRVLIKDRVVDDRLLNGGLIVGLIFALMTMIVVRESGQSIIVNRVYGNDIEGQGDVGGPNQLTTVNITVTSPEKSSLRLKADLYIRDMHNTLVYHTQQSTNSRRRKHDGSIGNFQFNFILEPQGSYLFSVKTHPNSYVGATHLKVKRGVRTLTPIDVVHLQRSRL